MKFKRIVLLLSVFLLTSCGGSTTFLPTSTPTSSEEKTSSETLPTSEETTTSEDTTTLETTSLQEYVKASFYDYDGTTLLSEQDVVKGEVPVFDKEKPTRVTDAQYTYEFTGWLPELAPISVATSYVAQYSSTTNKYTIKFVDEDGVTILQESTVDYGETPEYKEKEPTKAETALYSYKFKGWDKEIVKVTSDTIYTAVYEETHLFNFSVGDEYCWDITLDEKGNRTFKSLSDNSQLLMFNTHTFSSGTITFDLKHGSGTQKYNTTTGIVFGSDSLSASHEKGTYACTGIDPWGEFMTHSKAEGGFAWEDKNKLPAAYPDNAKTYSLKFSWNKTSNLINYYVDGNYKLSTPLVNRISGEYIGIYADNSGAEFSNIVINNTYESPKAIASFGTIDNWTIDDTNKIYTAKANGNFLMLPEYNFEGSHFVEYDINVLDNTTYYNCGSGIVLCSDQGAPTHNLGKFIVVGRDFWGGFNTFQKINGEFSWKNTNPFNGAMPAHNTVYHLKFYVDIENSKLVYYFNDTTHEEPFNCELTSAVNFGIYDDGLTTFSNINIHD